MCRNWVKVLVLLLLLPLTAMVYSCAEPTDVELLVGRWLLERATESVSTSTGAAEENDLPGFVGQMMELSAEGRCSRIDRGDTVVCEWYLTDARQLLLTRGMEVVEDYSVDDLSAEHLVLSHAYFSVDSLTNTRTHRLYRFEYSKQ